MTATPLTATLVRTRAVADPGPLVSRLPGPDGLAWVRRGDGVVAWGEAARVDLGGPGRFREASQWWRETCATMLVDDPVRLPGTGALAFGSFAFADDAGPSVLVVPRVVVGRRGGRSWVTTVGDAPPESPPSPVAAPVGVTYAEGSVSAVSYEEAVADAVALIATSPLEKVVLARDLLAVAEEPVDPRWLLARLAARYPACWTFAVDGQVGATPELLVRLERGLVTSRVLAGTIRRTGDDERDLVLAASLARSSKDLEEHEYAVRSVADALAPHCTGMNVPETPFVLHLPNVMHLATDIAAVAADMSSSLDLAAALHPTAAVCGTPRDLALDAIASLEGLDRGRYAGPVGWVDSTGGGEWGIALRSAVLDAGDPRRLRLYAGCGIVAGSDPEAELAESQAKLVPMRDALGG